MKFSKLGLNITVLAVLLISIGCTRPPDLPDTPQISYNKVEYEIRNEGQSFLEENILRLSFNVEDGNGDLGLGGNENFSPYNTYDLVVGTGGEYVEFGDRPGDPPFTCIDYAVENGENQDLNGDGDLLDTLLIDFNQNQYNIEVDFFVKESGEFREVELRAQPLAVNENTLCGLTFDGRFPCLSNADNPCNYVSSNDRPVEGVISYEMNSGLFLPLFRTDTLKLVFKIRDRALNESNAAETPEFTLQAIKVNSPSGD